ncbi:MAG: hypothetical protein SH818_07560 [Saprospiraceae bacterium]|nr:hypothetical protein [Saprospiraceae bacterium]
MKSLHLAVPAILLTIGSTVMMFVDGSSWAIGLALGIVALVVIFMLREAIDWKYYLKHPPKLELPVLNFVKKVPYYKQLSEEDKKKFRQRLALFVIAHQYRLQSTAGAEDDERIEAPEDLKAVCSIPAIILLFNQEDYLIPKIEQIVFYRHPFPSPIFNVLHHCEWNEEDKVLVFSIPHLYKGVIEPFIYFDLGLYEWMRAHGAILQEVYTWAQFEEKYQITQAQIVQAIGLPQPDLNAVCQVLNIHRSYLKEL